MLLLLLMKDYEGIITSGFAVLFSSAASFYRLDCCVIQAEHFVPVQPDLSMCEHSLTGPDNVGLVFEIPFFIFGKCAELFGLETLLIPPPPKSNNGSIKTISPLCMQSLH